MRKIALVGSPNVGKSVLFGRLTGNYVTVSNYPGTTVEVSRSSAHVGDERYAVADTPGLYSLYPATEDERVTVRILEEERPDLILHVIDAKNLERLLPLTFQLKTLGLPLICVLNMTDEAMRRGITINTEKLSKLLGVPVVATIAVTGQGMSHLLEVMKRTLTANTGNTEQTGTLPSYSEALLEQWHAQSRRIVSQATTSTSPRSGFSRLDRILLAPLTGLPILGMIIYVAFYQFVGRLGAGVVVDLLEGGFESHISPQLHALFLRYVPWDLLRQLFVGEYGILTLGIRYAVAIILPIVAFYFLAFAIIEDSGYLPRLGFLLDRALKKIGLSGRAIIPMVLGLGCVSMATVVTRTLPTKRERFIATLLLALCIPCAAQTGVIMGLLAVRPGVLAAWAIVILGVFTFVGAATSRLLPGKKPSFIVEVPPLRFPQPKNVLLKTFARVSWYFREVVPIFALASALIWVGQITGLFALAVRGIAWPLSLMGLPREAATAFLFGFFRRDYGAAGLYDLATSGMLSNNQLLVAAVVLTLFLPCITQLLLTIKERGLKIGFGLSAFVLIFAMLIGIVLNGAMQVLHIQF